MADDVPSCTPSAPGRRPRKASCKRCCGLLLARSPLQAGLCPPRGGLFFSCCPGHVALTAAVHQLGAGRTEVNRRCPALAAGTRSAPRWVGQGGLCWPHLGVESDSWPGPRNLHSHQMILGPEHGRSQVAHGMVTASTQRRALSVLTFLGEAWLSARAQALGSGPKTGSPGAPPV